MINTTGYRPDFSDEIQIDKFNLVTFFIQPLTEDLAKQYLKDEEVYAINACWHKKGNLMKYEYVAFIEQADFFRWLNMIKNGKKIETSNKWEVCEF